MEIQLSIFKHFKYSGKLEENKKTRMATIDLGNTKKKRSLANGFFTAVETQKFRWKNESD